jgi:hypothetical protein
MDFGAACFKNLEKKMPGGIRRAFSFQGFQEG